MINVLVALFSCFFISKEANFDLLFDSAIITATLSLSPFATTAALHIVECRLLRLLFLFFFLIGGFLRFEEFVLTFKNGEFVQFLLDLLF